MHNYYLSILSFVYLSFISCVSPMTMEITDQENTDILHNTKLAMFNNKNPHKSSHRTLNKNSKRGYPIPLSLHKFLCGTEKPKHYMVSRNNSYAIVVWDSNEYNPKIHLYYLQDENVLCYRLTDTLFSQKKIKEIAFDLSEKWVWFYLKKYEYRIGFKLPEKKLSHDCIECLKEFEFLRQQLESSNYCKVQSMASLRDSDFHDIMRDIITNESEQFIRKHKKALAILEKNHYITLPGDLNAY